MTLQLPIEEYFRYHPPNTPERIALHDRVNRESLEICKALIDNDPIQSSDRDTRIAKEDRVRGICERAVNLATDVCSDSDCWGWAIESIDECKSVALTCTTERRNTSILMRIQQFRMFLNQGITVDELKRQQLAGGIAAGQAEEVKVNSRSSQANIVFAEQLEIFHKLGFRDRIKVKLTDFGRAELERQHRELSDYIGSWRDYISKTEDAMGLSDWSIEDLMLSFPLTVGAQMPFEENFWVPLPNNPNPMLRFDIQAEKINNIELLHSGIHLTPDGDKWCALIGENLQVGIAGFGDDPIGALSDLYRELAGIELVIGVDSLGLKTVVDSYLSDTSNHEAWRDKALALHSDFLRSYQQAILDRRNGMSSIESKMSDIVLDFKEIGGGT